MIPDASSLEPRSERYPSFESSTSGVVLPEGCVAACHGCAHRTKSVGESLQQKESWLHSKLEPWEMQIAPIRSVSREGRWGYRDKVCLATNWSDDHWQFGLRVRDAVIPIPQCPVHSARVREVVRVLSAALPPASDFPMVYLAQSGAQATLVLKTNHLPVLDWLDQELKSSLEQCGLEGLWLHLHPSAGRKVFTRRDWHLLWGKPRSWDENGLVYGPTSFQQVIPALYEEAVRQAEDFLQPGTNDSVIDLYSGTGRTLNLWVRRGARTVGVELGGEAVACAVENAPTALMLRGMCVHRLPQLNAWIHEGGCGGRLLYTNPPRTGMEAKVLSWITCDYQPERVAYLSCSAGTLRRDLSVLVEGGHRVVQMIPFDFFPQTHHVEILVLLQRD